MDQETGFLLCAFSLASHSQRRHMGSEPADGRAVTAAAALCVSRTKHYYTDIIFQGSASDFEGETKVQCPVGPLTEESYRGSSNELALTTQTGATSGTKDPHVHTLGPKDNLWAQA